MSQFEPIDTRRRLILEAGARCFDRFGVGKTTMSDIADEARISRQALYRMYPDRQAVVDAILIMRVEELVAEVLQRALATSSFADALVEGTLGTVEFVRKTPDLQQALTGTALDHASRTLARAEQPGLELARLVWQPIIDRGRENGEVRDDLVDEDFVEWIASINIMYSTREDIPLGRLRTLLYRYLVPAAVRPSG